MTNEEFYDAEIAPVLMGLAKKCQRRDMPLICAVQYDKESDGVGFTETHSGDEKMCFVQVLVHWAARARGNVDKVFLTVDRHAQKHGHSSIYLQLVGNKNIQYSGSEFAAIAVTTHPQPPKGGTPYA
jgi:hypothetical protein